MLILFLVVLVVGAVVLGVPKMRKNGFFIRKKGFFHVLPVTDKQYKLSYEEFCALIASGGKIIIEKTHKYVLGNVYNGRIYNDLIIVEYRADFHKYGNLYEGSMTIKIGDKYYFFLSDLDKKLICNDLYDLDKKLSSKVDYEQNIESREYIINLIKNKLEADRKAYAEKLAKEKV